MKNFAILAILVSFVLLQGVANGLCQKPVLKHELKQQYKQGGYYYYVWHVKINNPPTGDPLKLLYLDLHPSSPLPYQIWNLDLKYPPRRYGLPNHVTAIKGGKYHEFGYIIRSKVHYNYPLKFNIYDYKCHPAGCNHCPLNYDPWCGADGKTYGNQCWARCAGVRPVKKGHC